MYPFQPLDVVVLLLTLEHQLYKAVSIQLIEEAYIPRPISKAPVLWSPQVPSKLEPNKDGQPSLPPAFTVNLHIPLGGPDGSRLSSLRSVTAYFHGRTGIFGLELAYAEGDSLLYGTKETKGQRGESTSCVAQTFVIDGPNSERIMLLSQGSMLSDTPVVGNIQVWSESFTLLLYFHNSKMSKLLANSESPRFGPTLEDIILLVLPMATPSNTGRSCKAEAPLSP